MNEIRFEYDIHEYHPPFYIFDTDILAEQIRKIRDFLGEDVELCYAMKANPFVIKDLEEVVDSFEVCSPGEFTICERAGIDMGKVIMSGVHKKPEDIEYALRHYGDKIIYTVESLSHWQILRDCSSKLQTPIRVLLRLTSGNQFGMDESMIRQIMEGGSHEFITIEGIQYFSGTQKKSIAKLENELHMLDQLCRELNQEYGFPVKRLEYGPGLPVCYFEGEKNEEDQMLNGLAECIKNLSFGGRVTLEMGRFIAAPCGFYVTSVVDQKTNKGEPYCIVDGGIHQLNYYGQMLAMKKPPILHFNQREGEKKEWTVCGSLCTVNDVLVKKYPFQNLQIGDRIIFQKTGAYSATEGMSLFLSRDLPQILLYSAKDNFRIARPHLQTNAFNYFQL
ncbi:diaminopimelate decarboxylase family protein [Lacrimispora celerecrescens]|uniref:diaminopimelate decarboxylase family protein n=1 Tax=Lacrimispora celerecrescens TaxID=29354 RepID=UPI001645BE48|nr:alanine racemase [Lacrimispora celerecrescens]